VHHLFGDNMPNRLFKPLHIESKHTHETLKIRPKHEIVNIAVKAINSRTKLQNIHKDYKHIIAKRNLTISFMSIFLLELKNQIGKEQFEAIKKIAYDKFDKQYPRIE
jgi:hypothetical protein